MKVILTLEDVDDNNISMTFQKQSNGIDDDNDESMSMLFAKAIIQFMDAHGDFSKVN